MVNSGHKKVPFPLIFLQVKKCVQHISYKHGSPNTNLSRCSSTGVAWCRRSL